jgi:hypothetical protein
MSTLVISQQEVPALLPMRACVDVMADALRATSRGDAVLPLDAQGPRPVGLLA